MEIIDWVAIWGGVSGTLGALWHLRNWWYDRPHVTVKVNYALIKTGVTDLHAITLSAVNKGKRRIQLTQAGFGIKGSNILFPYATAQFPRWLEPGSRQTVDFPLLELVNALMQANQGQRPPFAWFKDATDKTYKTAVSVKEFSSWLKVAKEMP